MARDYYDVLEVSRFANMGEIKRAYRRLAKKYHPDISQFPGAEERFKEINEAYEALSDKRKRKSYDRSSNKGSDQKQNAKQRSDSDQNNDTGGKERKRPSQQERRAETPRRENMYSDSIENNDLHSLRGIRTGCLLAFFVLFIIFLVSPQIASFFLSISRAANHSAHNEVLASFLDPRPTNLPLPTYTPMPTYTPLPTHTPRPTYTPYPTSTPIPPAIIFQRLESQAQLVVVQNDMINRGFHVGVAEGLCSHGADFSAQGVIEAGINFDDINDENINYDPSSQSYTLKLPATEFTSCRIDYIRLTRADFSMCNPDFDRARQFAEFQVMLEFVEKSREDGLLEEAEERSTLILGDFVRNLTGKPVHVTFEEREGEPTMSASCHPEIPGDWHYDRSRNAWRKRDGR